jgi:hypothetical protein
VLFVPDKLVAIRALIDPDLPVRRVTTKHASKDSRHPAIIAERLQGMQGLVGGCVDRRLHLTMLCDSWGRFGSLADKLHASASLLQASNNHVVPHSGTQIQLSMACAVGFTFYAGAGVFLSQINIFPVAADLSAAFFVGEIAHRLRLEFRASS